MWFKQVQIFQLATPIAYDAEQLHAQLEPLTFTPCLPSFPSSHGWVPSVDIDNNEDGTASLVHAANHCMMFCLQVEEKILPATVIRQELERKVKEIETHHDRKLSHKQKLALKDEIMFTLLPRAFSKLTRIHAYIDTRNQWLILNTVNASKTETFLELLKKSLAKADIKPVETGKLAMMITRWLTHHDYPHIFSIDKSCVLNDPKQKNRIIRCQQQDLFANGIQAIIKDGCEVKKLAIVWQDRINFTLADNFSLQGIQYQDEITAQAKEMEPETQQQQFVADFFIMTETLAALFKDLLQQFALVPNATVAAPSESVAEPEHA